VTASDPDPDLEILREAERRRGGCGAFLAGMLVFLLIFFGLMVVDTVAAGYFPPGWERYFGMFYLGRLVLAIAGAIGAANLFTKVRLRMTGKSRPESGR
jgi:hypothetical protein